MLHPDFLSSRKYLFSSTSNRISNFTKPTVMQMQLSLSNNSLNIKIQVKMISPLLNACLLRLGALLIQKASFYRHWSAENALCGKCGSCVMINNYILRKPFARNKWGISGAHDGMKIHYLFTKLAARWNETILPVSFTSAMIEHPRPEMIYQPDIKFP